MRRGRPARGPASRGTEQAETSRRGFLRRAGLTGAVAAGFVGIADVTGLSSALAAASPKLTGQKHAHGEVLQGLEPGEDASGARRSDYCVYQSCNCHGCCPSGTCCYYCTGNCGNFHTCFRRPSGGCGAPIVYTC